MGLGLLASIPGFACSSTRAELVGAIVAMVSSGPVHIGTDSQSMMTKALAIQHHLRHHTRPRRPISLQPDSDLWTMFHHHMAAKSVDSVTFTKLKGHATPDMVAQGTIAKADMQGNEHADTQANEVVQQHGQHVVLLADYYAHRHMAYKDLTKHLHRHIVFMFQVRQHLVAKQQGTQPDTTTPPTTHPTQKQVSLR